MREEMVAIEKLAFGGAGLGRVRGKVCFVTLTAPGDVVRVGIAAEKKSFLRGELLQVVEPSHIRTVPPCGVFGSCGGCCWQHLPYEVQLRAKQEIFAETLARGARVSSEAIQSVIPAETPYGYRSRVQLKVRSAGGELHMGFYRPGSHFVVGLPGRCMIAGESVNRIYSLIRPILERFPEPDRIPQVDVAAGDDGRALLLLHYIGEKPDDAAEWLDGNLPEDAPVSGLFLQTGRKATIRKIRGDDRISYRLPEGLVPGLPAMRLSFRCGGFSQVNYGQNRRLVETLLTWARLKGTERVLDLFCGNGNFTIPVSRFCAEVTGLEDFEQSIEDAAWNARENGVTNARFLCRDSVGGVKDLLAKGERFDMVILDPPRTGSLETVRLIPDLGPGKIVYISCDPTTLARDLAALMSRGYMVVSSRPVDMFPQTYHIESVTLLQRK